MSRAHVKPATQLPAAGAESAEDSEKPEESEESEESEDINRPPHRRRAANLTHAAVRPALRLLIDASLVGVVAGVVAGFVGSISTMRATPSSTPPTVPWLTRSV
jgi:hypothetical protein